MLNLAEIREEIDKLEQMETNYQNCSKLAILYAIYDRNQKPDSRLQYSYASSEFLQVVAEAPIDEALAIIDEHMECIKALYPKEYSALINKIKKIS